ncbi:MAG TPA: GDSL-type esterase/lipase family protein [Candidatus Methylacidiphilales bacterium]|jgi:lysophospholipase L1-like esterase|nr:GDSL-type esterase/lipase family protein [Candidatus Methylacidiphilales bacterium]
MKTLLPALLAVLSFITLRADDPSVSWPPPPLPAGPVATHAAPRIDWLYRFQHNLDIYKGPHDMIFEGDSITDGWQGGGKTVWAEHFGKIKVADFGISGDQVQHLLWRVQHGQLDGQDPKLVMIMIGTNNVNQKPEDVAAGIKMLIGEYETRCPHAQILLLAVFPRSPKATDAPRLWVSKVNAIISGYNSDPRVTYLDFGKNFLTDDGTLTKEIMPDALHPSPQGYEIWAKAITPVVEKYFPGQLGPASSTPAAK